MDDDGAVVIEDLQAIDDVPFHLVGMVQSINKNKIEGAAIHGKELIRRHLIRCIQADIRVDTYLCPASDPVQIVRFHSLADLQVGLIVVLFYQRIQYRRSP